jgi:CRISPR/Cas system-associated exonuclease Cas4 (RecB family)
MTRLPHIRPSALPKLDLQPCFVGAGGEASEAAKRGTAIDKVWRTVLDCKPIDWDEFGWLTNEDWDAIVWAVEEARAFCGDSHIETNEEKTQFTHPYFLNPFTADGVCTEKRIILDLKTGQLRSYRAQLAAYCLALMTETWTEKAAGVAIFCDQRESVHYEFTFKEANEYVTAIIDAVLARKPDEFTPGEYCGWCANADTCPARTQDAEGALALVATEEKSLAAMREHILSDPARMGEFWRQYKLFEKEIADPIGKAIKEQLDAGSTIPGWRIRYDSGREFFDAEAISAVANEITTEELITLLGAKCSGKTFREFCAVKGLAVPEQFARTGAQIAKLMPEKKKKG